MGVVAFAESLADEVGRDGILVNNVCPGSILTERMLSNVTARAREVGISVEAGLAQRAAETAVGRIGEPKRSEERRVGKEWRCGWRRWRVRRKLGGCEGTAMC